ncbi:unnamed protein product [Oppiella nova]|uniref:MAGUK p55 subfamily member 6 n=1 Tax=Oppiella nova TaxID=334625 RepID=A0A7R9QAN8_9ACAR|nr:unnamed protein product [Oppiella nova]CAG2161381.1 unnamed protein product [Oppiella nova]
MKGRKQSGSDGQSGGETSSLLQDVKQMCSKLSLKNRNAAELNLLLSNPHVAGLAEAHDNCLTKDYDGRGDTPDGNIQSYEMDVFGSESGDEAITQAIRMVGIRKSDNEPLGMTVALEDGLIVIARILAGSVIDRQGLLHVGDVILEANGIEITSPEQLQEELRKCKGGVTLKVSPSSKDVPQPSICYMRALYNYDPTEDSLLPCREVGLAFKQGDILEIVNTEDPNWWQARSVEAPHTHAGLIPSQELEERRRAFVRPEFDYATRTSICGTKITKKKKKEMYQLQANADFDKAELLLYEEVCRTPPFERKTLILVGAQGVGRRTLKSRIIAYDTDRFATPLPHTSRPIRDGEQDGKQYHFVRRDIMEGEIADNKYLEFGEFQDHLYGTRLDSIRAIIRSGRMCVIDCNPQSLKMLKTAEFMPYIVFVAAPPLDQLRYMHEYGRHQGLGGSRYQTFDRALGRHSSRRVRTLQSLASFYEDEDLQVTVEESARLQRAYDKFFDLVIVNNNFEKTFEQLRDAVDALTIEHQWVPIDWVYSDD